MSCSLKNLHWKYTIFKYFFANLQNTFRVNMIWGRKLLLLDAAALSAMNIKNFDHIKHITYGIRMLFHFELTKFSHSISLPDEKPFELYLLWHIQTGINNDAVRRSDLYRRMQLIRERSLNLEHWDLLYMWLRREQERKYTEIIGLTKHHNMYLCGKKKKVKESDMVKDAGESHVCTICVPPCECDWTAEDTMLPWRLSCLSPGLINTKSKWLANESRCTKCIPPCECHWPSRYYLTGTVIKCLQVKFPAKFSPIFDERISSTLRPSLVARWTRFSIWNPYSIGILIHYNTHLSVW